MYVCMYVCMYVYPSQSIRNGAVGMAKIVGHLIRIKDGRVSTRCLTAVRVLGCYLQQGMFYGDSWLDGY